VELVVDKLVARWLVDEETTKRELKRIKLEEKK
jgi:hypothetical protein